MKKWIDLWDGYKFDGDFIYDRDTNKISQYDIDNVWIQRQLFELQVSHPRKIGYLKKRIDERLEELAEPVEISFKYQGRVMRTVELQLLSKWDLGLKIKNNKTSK